MQILSRTAIGLSFALVVASSCAAPAAVAPIAAGQEVRALPGPHAQAVRFVALGDAGSGGDDAKRVVEAAREACAGLGGCDFGVLLGDNVYPRGIGGADDPAWDAKVEAPLRPLGIPFFAVLGNHDYGAPDELFFLGPIGVDPRRAEAALGRARASTTVRMDGRAYSVDVGPAQLVFFDTQPHYWLDLPPVAGALNLEREARRIDRALAVAELQSRARWRIAVGHHPVRSNGAHGDAGSFEVFPSGAPFSGTRLREFFEARVLGRFDLYLSGHDHNLEDMGDERGTALVVSGAGSEHRPLHNTRPVPFAADSLGFVLVDVTQASIVLRFVTVDDRDGPTAGRWRVAHERALSLR